MVFGLTLFTTICGTYITITSYLWLHKHTKEGISESKEMTVKEMLEELEEIVE